MFAGYCPSVRNRSQPFAVLPYGRACKFYRSGHFWRFHMSHDVRDHFVWQAQYFCDVCRTCGVFFVAGTVLWTYPASFFLAGAVLQTCRISCLSEIALTRLYEVVIDCKLRGRRGILRDMLKLGGKPRRDYGGSCKTCASEGVTERVWLRTIYGGSYKIFTFRNYRIVQIGGSLGLNVRFQAPTCILLCLWLNDIYGGYYRSFIFRNYRNIKIKGGFVRNTYVYLI